MILNFMNLDKILSDFLYPSPVILRFSGRVHQKFYYNLISFFNISKRNSNYFTNKF